MPNDYIPANDAEFLAWSANFFTVLNAHLATLGLTASDLAPVATAQTTYANSVTNQRTQQALLDAAVVTKKTDRESYEPPVRTLVKRIQVHPAMTDALRAQLGISISPTTRKRRTAGPEIPTLHLETRPGQVIIHFGTRPKWAAGCHIYRKKPGETDFTLIAFDTATPYVDTITGPAITVSYRAAFRGTKDTDEGGLCPEQSVAAGG